MNRAGVGFLALVLSSVCLAQTDQPLPSAASHPAQAFPLLKVAAIGSKRYAEADIVHATGLKPGGPVTADDLKAAADRLGQTSVFSQVSYRFDGQIAEYTVVDAEQFVPARFENFIWFSDEALQQKAHASFPLFQGQLPLAGTLADQVASALDELLKEKGISGHTVAAMQSSQTGQPLAVRFQVEGVTERIAEFRFPGAGPERLPLLQAATKRLLGEDYHKTFVTDQVRRSAAPVYAKLGFLKARVNPLKPTILKDDPRQPEVVLEVPVQEGDAYTFSAVNWTGATVIPVAELAKSVALKPGDPADAMQLPGALSAVRELYGTKGHMYVQVKSAATMDSEKHSAAFNLSIDEGPVYKMGKLEIQNLDPKRTALVMRVWGIHEGDVYNASYVNTFLSKHPVELAELDGWTTRFTQTIHDDTQSVDLVLAFEKIRPDAK